MARPGSRCPTTAARTSRGYLLPFPYIIYRGERFRVDRQGLRGIFFESDRIEFNLSVNATPPVDEDNRARQECRNSIRRSRSACAWISRWRATASANGRSRRAFRCAPLSRPIFRIPSTSDGWLIRISISLRGRISASKWNLGLQGGPLFATPEYHQYFYGVDPQFATPERPAYQASGGYSGALALVSLSRRFPRVWVGPSRATTFSKARYSTIARSCGATTLSWPASPSPGCSPSRRRKSKSTSTNEVVEFPTGS